MDTVVLEFLEVECLAAIVEVVQGVVLLVGLGVFALNLVNGNGKVGAY